MSSQKTPKSPNLSPTMDLEQSFFQVLAFHSSDQPHAIQPSEASSPISPMTEQTARKRPPPRAHPEIYTPINMSTACASMIRRLSAVISGEPPSLKVTKPSEAGLSNSNASRSSSVSNRTRKLLRGSWSRSVSASSEDAELQQEDNVDRNRKRESSRHWLDIRRRRKMRSDRQSSTNSEDAPFDVPSATPIQNTARTSEATPKETPILNTPQTSEAIPKPKEDPILVESSPRHETPALLEVNQKSGFYHRAKSRLGLSQEPNDSAHEHQRTKTFTGEVLERAATMLREISDKMLTTPSSTTSGSNKSSRSNLSWHTHSARLIPFYSRIRSSSSSSVHNERMGNAPQTSPNPQAMYTGSDSKQYLCVEISNPDGPTYLPSEARRICTPPSPKSTLNRKLRGFFFDYNAPLTPSSDVVESHPLASRGRRKEGRSEIDWYRVKLAADEANDAQHPFELNVPEHLPNSPLCPKNPKHRSGGKGVCVYHGRNKAIQTPLEE